MLCVTHQNYSLFMIKYGCTIYIIVLADIIAKVVKSEGSPYDHREEEFDERLWCIDHTYFDDLRCYHLF